MDDDEIFRLNSLSRFTKSSKLVLEAHSHCEVPAGCGGALLQWVNPAKGVPVRVEVVSSRAMSGTWFDGSPVGSHGKRLQAGEHVLTLLCTPSSMRTAASDAGKWILVNMTRRASAAKEDPVSSGSSVDASGWLATTTKPPDDWRLASLDDRSWTAMKECRVAIRDLAEWQGHQVTRLQRRGCLALELPDAPEVYVRRRFVLPEVTP